MCGGDLTKRDEVSENYTIVDAVKWLQLQRYEGWIREQSEDINRPKEK